MKTITEEEMNKYLVSIGGLENGYFTDRSKLMDCGFMEVNKGWYGLIKSCIEEMIAAGWNKQVCQIKEKFAGLRFYTGGCTDEQHKIINKYEKLSEKTCENCGKPGEIILKSGWFRCECETCKKL